MAGIGTGFWAFRWVGWHCCCVAARRAIDLGQRTSPCLHAVRPALQLYLFFAALYNLMVLGLDECAMHFVHSVWTPTTREACAAGLAKVSTHSYQEAADQYIMSLDSESKAAQPRVQPSPAQRELSVAWMDGWLHAVTMRATGLPPIAEGCYGETQSVQVCRCAGVCVRSCRLPPSRTLLCRAHTCVQHDPWCERMLFSTLWLRASLRQPSPFLR